MAIDLHTHSICSDGSDKPEQIVERAASLGLRAVALTDHDTAEGIEGVSRWSLKQVARAGYLLPEVMVVDGTHIKANANLEKHMKKAIPGMAKRYQEQLGN